jgi:hypothetical protein
MNIIMSDTQALLYKVSEEYHIDYNELIKKFSSEKTEKSIDSINPINRIQDTKKTIDFFNQKKNYVPDKKDTIKQPRRRNINDTIKTYKILYNSTHYLVDDRNNVYTFDIMKPKIIGVRLIDQSIKFY